MRTGQIIRDLEYTGRKLICTKCGALMCDAEPMIGQGEFWHPSNGCANSNSRTFGFEPNKRSQSHVHGIQTWMPKKDRRARKRGAKLAGKMCPSNYHA